MTTELTEPDRTGSPETASGGDAPFHLATRLRGSRLDELGEEHPEVRAFLTLDHPEQQELLLEVLVARGIDPTAAEAVATSPRHEFVVDDQRTRAYVDVYLEAKAGSGLSPPSLVAQMLERLRWHELEEVEEPLLLELGAGSCFHLVAALRLCPRARAVGLESDGDVIASAERRLRRLGESRIELVHGADASALERRGPFHRIWATYAYANRVIDLLPLLADGGLLQLPRMIGPHEFARDPIFDQTRAKYATYEEMLPEWRINLCLATYRREGERLRSVTKLPGISFVTQRDEITPPSESR